MNTKLTTIIAMIVICVAFASIELASQSKEYTDSVVLKNGTELNGVQVEEAYVVTSSDGKATVYKKSEVSEVKKGDNSKASGAAPGSENWSANLGYMDWEEAKAKCASQKMRLPSLDELKSAQAGKITDSWKKQGYLYWSTTPDTGGDPQLLYAFTGQIYSLSKYSSSYVRCVK